MDLIYFLYTLLLLGSEKVSTDNNGISMSIPSNVKDGEEVNLYCLYDLKGSRLHTVKWFLNGKEFYRYVRVGRPQQIDYSVPGIKLNLIASDGERVVLSKVTPASAGLYRCEVMTEDSYQTLIGEGNLMVVESSAQVKADKSSKSAKSSSESNERTSKPSGLPKPVPRVVVTRPQTTSSSSFSLFYLLEKMFVAFSFCYYVYAIFQFVQKMYEEHEEYEEEIVTKRRFSELLDRESRTDHMRRLSMRFPEEAPGIREENVSNEQATDANIEQTYNQSNIYSNDHENENIHSNISNYNISGSKQRPEEDTLRIICSKRCTNEAEDEEEYNNLETSSIELEKTKKKLKDYVDHHHMRSKEESVVNIADIKPLLDAKSFDEDANNMSTSNISSDMNNNPKNINNSNAMYQHPEIICNKTPNIGTLNMSNVETPNKNKNIISKDSCMGSFPSLNMNITTCHGCHSDLREKQFLIKNEYPYCISCYDANFGNKCSECNQLIAVGSKDLSFGERHWHSECLKCSQCNEVISSKPFQTSKTDANKIYCTSCYDNTFCTTICHGCQQRIKSGSCCLQHGGHSWHGKCFCCNQCGTSIARNTFTSRNDKYYCIQCYKDYIAHKCHRCTEALIEGGIKFREDYWHWNCFYCLNCQSNLSGKLFFIPKDHDDPYCNDCYGLLFAIKCIKCLKPIIGEKGIKMITLEDKNWHSECFNCYNCSASLVDQGFIIASDDIEEFLNIKPKEASQVASADLASEAASNTDAKEVKIICEKCATTNE